MKCSPLIWRYVVNVKSTVKISSIFVAFLENINFNMNDIWHSSYFQSLLLNRDIGKFAPFIFMYCYEYVYFYLLSLKVA